MDALFLLRGFAALVFVLGLIGAFAYVAKRFGLLQQARPGRQLQVVESCTLDARHRLVLFRCGERHHVALIGPTTCQFLNDEIDLSDLTETEAPEAPGNVVGWPQALSSMSLKSMSLKSMSLKSMAAGRRS